MTDFDTWPKDVVSTREADGISVVGAVIIYFMRKDVNISSIFMALEMMKCGHLILQRADICVSLMNRVPEGPGKLFIQRLIEAKGRLTREADDSRYKVFSETRYKLNLLCKYYLKVNK
jgi:hypothetical protein